MKSPIFGSYEVSRSTNLAADRCINLYPEIAETKQGKAIGALFLCPGLRLLGTLGPGPIRGLHRVGSSLLAVSGSDLYALDTSFNASLVGSGIDDGAVSMIDNGTQLAIFAGIRGYLWSRTTVFGAIVLPFPAGPPSISGCYQDGFGIIGQPGTAFLFQSDLLDLSTWSALNFADASGDPDNVVAVAQMERQIWVLKERETEIWYNAGTTGFAFARLDGAYIEFGCVAAASVAQADNRLVWLSQNDAGQGVVVQTRGHEAQRISSHAVETAIAGYATIADATAYAYQQGGHLFYVINFPSGDATWCCDLTASELLRMPMWHQRSAFSDGQFHRHPAAYQSAFAGINVVGDASNGNLYALDPNVLTDNGAARKWLRSWRALPQPVDRPVRFAELRIDMQSGIGIDPAANPQVMLRWSDDGGHNFSDEHLAAAGIMGETAQRVIFRRLGSTRRQSGLDRIFELSGSDAMPVAIIGAELTAA